MRNKRVFSTKHDLRIMLGPCLEIDIITTGLQSPGCSAQIVDVCIY